MHQLHGEERLGGTVEELAQGDDVRVHEVVHGAELLLEARQPLPGGAPQRLERHDLAELAIERLVHDAHATRAQLTPDLEAAASIEQRRGVHGARRSVACHLAVGAAPRAGVERRREARRPT